MKSTIHTLLRPLALGVLLASPLAMQQAHAENLQQIFDLASKKDPEILGARAKYDATHTLLDQGKSLLLPTISATGSESRDTSGLATTPPPTIHAAEHSFGDGYITKAYGLNLTQAVLNFKAWYSYQSAKKGDDGALLTLQQSEQALIIKVATAYTNVLRSKANLASFITEEKAAQQVLEQTKQRFDVGLVAITDVYDSQASADLAAVNTLTEANNLRQRLDTLGAITGLKYMDVDSLSDDYPIVAVNPATPDAWIKIAEESNLAIKIAALDLESKTYDAKAAKSDYYPTVSLTTTYNWTQSGNPFSFTPGLATEGSSVKLNLTIPLYTGGLTNSRMKQANYTRDASEDALLKARRDNTVGASNAYRSVETDVKAVAARAQAIKSAQSSMDATRTGAEVGTRNIVDVVLSQRSLFQAQRDYANARIQYVMDILTLKQAAGVLSPQDVIDLNQWLKP
ncbi:MAG TPA: TolC family outer membrane protein [Candidatus Acidoferrum sp.]|nr:TolC family outer membrane protein [Candidatus Acidoferrum sp.]